MPNIFNIEWLNANSQRRYPLAVDATCTDTTESFRLPDSVLVGMTLPIPASLDVDLTAFYLRRVIAYATGVTLEFAYDDGVTSTTVATTTISRDAHVENNQYPLIGVGDFAATRGSIVVGDLDAITASGMFLFARADGKLDPTIVRLVPQGLSGVYITSGNTTYGPFLDDIEIVLGSNLQPTITTVGTLTTVRVDGIEGANLTAPCVCAGGQSVPAPIRSIGGLLANADGNFPLIGTGNITVRAGSGGGIEVENTAATPCCGCTELEVITAELQHLTDERVPYRTALEEARTFTEVVRATILGARLGDDPCISE